MRPLLLGRGALGVLTVLASVFWPGAGLPAVAGLAAVFLILDGGLVLGLSARTGPGTHVRRALLAQGVAGLLAGAIALVVPHAGPGPLHAVLAVWGLLAGALGVAAGAASSALPGRRDWVIAGGLAVLLGVLLVAFPHAGGKTLLGLLGGYAVMTGVLWLLNALSIRPRA